MSAVSNKNSQKTDSQDKQSLDEKTGFNFWPWFVFGLPFLTVIAGIITYQIAATNSDSIVQDDYFKKGLAINQSLIKDKQAQKWQLNAKLSRDLQSKLILLYLQSAAGKGLSADQTQEPWQSSNQLLLEFFHPTQKSQDTKVFLEHLIANEYAGQLPPLSNALWHIRLSDPAKINDPLKDWQLKSRWQITTQETTEISTPAINLSEQTNTNHE